MKEQEWINWCWRDTLKGMGVAITIYLGLLLAYWFLVD
jgi:hypothetical protein